MMASLTNIFCKETVSLLGCASSWVWTHHPDAVQEHAGKHETLLRVNCYKPSFIAGRWSDSRNHDCGHAAGELDFCSPLSMFPFENVSFPFLGCCSCGWFFGDPPSQKDLCESELNLKLYHNLILCSRLVIYPLGSANRRWLISSTNRCISAAWRRSWIESCGNIFMAAIFWEPD